VRSVIGQRVWPLLAVAILAALLFPVQQSIDRERHRIGLVSGESYLADLPVGEFFATVALGGFRAVAVDIIWMRLERLQDERAFFEIPSLCRLISMLQPRFVEVWLFNSWNMAYNLSYASETLDDAYAWIRDGIEFLKRGVKKNPKAWKLYWHIGYTYYHKCATLKTEDTAYFRKRVKEDTGQDSLELAAEWFGKAAEFKDAMASYVSMLPVVYEIMAEEAGEQLVVALKEGNAKLAQAKRKEVFAAREKCYLACKKLMERDQYARWSPLSYKVEYVLNVAAAYDAFDRYKALPPDAGLDERVKVVSELANRWTEAYRHTAQALETRYFFEQALLEFEKVLAEVEKTRPEEARQMKEFLMEAWALGMKEQRSLKKPIPVSIERVKSYALEFEKKAEQAKTPEEREAMLLRAGRFWSELYYGGYKEYKDHFAPVALYLLKEYAIKRYSYPEAVEAQNILDEYLASHPSDVFAKQLLEEVKKTIARMEADVEEAKKNIPLPQDSRQQR